MRNNVSAPKNAKSSRKRTVWLIILGIVLVLLIFGGIEVYRILYTPQALFNVSKLTPAPQTAQPTPELTTAAPAGTDTAATAEPTAAPTPSPTIDVTQGKDIVNILLIGIDRRQGDEGDDKGTNGGKNGTEPHADVQMIVAVNFKEKKVDLISILRDTFVYEPDLMPGAYKINATFNIGGGFSDTSAAFRKVCDGASYMLGGIPIDYYCAVDFDALVKLVDDIGGVDFDVDSPSYSREHKAGMQHMTGEDVLFYVRNRKLGPEVHDAARVDRQKELMITIFNQLKKNGKLSMVPNLITTADNGIFTNMSVEQMLALVNLAKNIDPNNIGAHSFPATYCGGLLDRMWYFTDQPGRQQLIKQVYGIDVPVQVHSSQDFASWLDNYGFGGVVYLKTGKKLLDYADTQKASFTDDQKQAYDTLTADYTQLQQAWNNASLTLKSADTRAMLAAMNQLKPDATALAKAVGYTDKLSWTYDHQHFWLDPQINEVTVDLN